MLNIKALALSVFYKNFLGFDYMYIMKIKDPQGGGGANFDPRAII
jgi:hypothetical protein